MSETIFSDSLFQLLFVHLTKKLIVPLSYSDFSEQQMGEMLAQCGVFVSLENYFVKSIHSKTF